MTKRLWGKLLTGVGILLLLTAATLFTLHQREAYIAGENARTLLQELSDGIQENRESAMYDTAVTEPVTGQMPQLTVSGYETVGVIQIPSVHMELPVLDTWDYELLKISPCRYSGSLEGGDLILLGHNYVEHFAPLRKVKVGDTVEFYDVTGVRHGFVVSATETLKATELERLVAAEHPLSIFTCTRDGISRFVVRCDYAR